MDRLRFVFAGSGGQGLITAAIILGRAAVEHEGLSAVQSQSYGAAARGGVSRSDLVISDSEINYPKVNQPNVLVCLSQDAYSSSYSIIRPGGLLLVDRHFVQVQRKADARQKSLPMYERIMQDIGKPIVLNICMLGALQAYTQAVKLDSILQVLKDTVPRQFIEINEKALNIGVDLAESNAS